MVRWPLQPLQPLQKTQLQPPFGPSVDALCHPCITTTRLSYSVLSLKLPPPPCAVLLVQCKYTHVQLDVCPDLLPGIWKYSQRAVNKRWSKNSGGPDANRNLNGLSSAVRSQEPKGFGAGGRPCTSARISIWSFSSTLKQQRAVYHWPCIPCLMLIGCKTRPSHFEATVSVI